MSDAETLVTTLRDYFIDNWNAKVDGLNDGYEAATDPQDPIRLKHLAKAFTAERQRTSIQQFPVIYILSTDSWNTNWGQSRDDWSHEVEIGIIEQHQKPDTLDTLLKRYVEDVMWSLLKAGHFAGDIGGYHLVTATEAGTAPVTIDWGPAMPGGGSMMTQDAKLTLRMEA